MMLHRPSILRLSPLLIALLIGCNPSQGQGAAEQTPNDADKPSRPPSAQDMLEATAPGYKTPPGMQQDCLGRLVFDVAQPVQWPTFYKGDSSTLFNRSFSKKVFDRGDEMRVGNTKVAVIGPADANIRKDVLSGTPWSRIEDLRNDVKRKFEYIGRLKKEKLPTEKKNKAVKDAEEKIQGWEETIKEIQEKYAPFDPGLPNSEGYWTSKTEGSTEPDHYSIYRAFLMRGQYIYIFESDEKITKNMDKEKHKQQFVATLNKFRTRKPNEVPTELGVCIPHGFIPDDGKTITDIKQSLRWPDAPGVLYTIYTGNVDPRRLKATVLLASVRATVGAFGSQEEEEIKPHLSQRIGPRPYKIGGLTSEQGGFALKVNKPGQAPFEAYTVFTGYSGWLGTAVLPYILVDMRTHTKEQAPELKQNPPPFKQSMGRLEALLKGMRLRPTNPLMPDLANLQKQ
jgi:hypothetical protein